MRIHRSSIAAVLIGATAVSLTAGCNRSAPGEALNTSELSAMRGRAKIAKAERRKANQAASDAATIEFLKRTEPQYFGLRDTITTVQKTMREMPPTPGAPQKGPWRDRMNIALQAMNGKGIQMQNIKPVPASCAKLNRLFDEMGQYASMYSTELGGAYDTASIARLDNASRYFDAINKVAAEVNAEVAALNASQR